MNTVEQTPANEESKQNNVDPLTRRSKRDHQATFEGAPLMNALFAKAYANGDAPPQLAKDLDITYAYLMALGRGERPVSQLDRKVIRTAAEYLEIPVAQAFLLSENLLAIDFSYEPTVDQKFRMIYKAMSDDPIWCGYIPDLQQWDLLEPNIKMLIALMYERSARTQFFSEQ